MIKIFYLGCVIPESLRVEADAIVNDSDGNKMQRLFNLFQRDNDNLPDEEMLIAIYNTNNLPSANVFKNNKRIALIISENE